VIDELAGADIVVSYPVFQSLYQTPAIRGREAVKALSADFCNYSALQRLHLHKESKNDH
jgi:hypothetical protein